MLIGNLQCLTVKQSSPVLLIFHEHDQAFVDELGFVDLSTAMFDWTLSVDQ